MANYIAVYGSLRRGMQADHKMSRMEFVGQGRINASLFALGWYPGVKLDTGHSTVVDVFRLSKDERMREAILWDLDGYEGFNPQHPEGSLFVRKTVKVEMNASLDDITLKAYVYEYNYPVNRAPLVENGDWNDFQNAAPQGT